MPSVQRISACLHFPGTAEDAVTTYVSILPDSRVVSVQRYGAGAPLPEGTPMFYVFELLGTRFHAINGVADWAFNEAMSLMVRCDDQAEIDRCWGALLENGGEPMACGWLRDRFGVCWQIVPTRLEEWMSSDDEVAKGRLMQALWTMVKLDVAALEAAYHGRS